MCNTMLGPVFLLFFYFVFFSSVIYKQIKKKVMPEQHWSSQHIRMGFCLLKLMKPSHALNLMRHSPRFIHLIYFNTLSLHPPHPMPAIQPHAMDDPQIMTEQCMLLISQSFRTLPSPPTHCLLCAWLCFAPSDLCVDNVIVHLEPMKCSPNELRNDRHVRIITNSSTLDTHCVYMQTSQQFWLPSWIVCCFIIVCSEVD